MSFFLRYCAKSCSFTSSARFDLLFSIQIH